MSSRSIRSQRRSRRSEGGFTIFEVAMSAAILAMAIATSLTVIQSGFRAMDTARNTTIAGQILQSVMEDLRMLPWDATSPSTATTITSLQSTSNGVAGNVTLGSSFTNDDAAAIAMVSKFTITRTIADVATDLKNITLTASWTGIDNRSHTLTYSSYYGKGGMHDYFIK